MAVKEGDLDFDFSDDNFDEVVSDGDINSQRDASFFEKTLASLKENSSEVVSASGARSMAFDVAEGVAVGTGLKELYDEATKSKESIRSIKEFTHRMSSAMAEKTGGNLGKVGAYIAKKTKVERQTKAPTALDLLREREGRNNDSTKTLIDSIFDTSNDSDDNLMAMHRITEQRSVTHHKDALAGQSALISGVTDMNAEQKRQHVDTLQASMQISAGLSGISAFQREVQSKVYAAQLDMDGKRTFMLKELLRDSMRFHTTTTDQMTNLIKVTSRPDVEKHSLTSLALESGEDALGGVLGDVLGSFASSLNRANDTVSAFGDFNKKSIPQMLGSSVRHATGAVTSRIGDFISGTSAAQAIKSGIKGTPSFVEKLNKRVGELDEEEGNLLQRFAKRKAKGAFGSFYDLINKKNDISGGQGLQTHNLLEDPRTNTTINVVVPTLLSKILSSVSGSGEELSYDHDTAKFSTVNKLKAGAREDFSSMMGSGVKDKASIAVDAILGDEKVSARTRKDIENAIVSSSLESIVHKKGSDGITGIEGLASSGLFDKLPAAQRKKVMDILEKRSASSSLIDRMGVSAAMSETRADPRKTKSAVNAIINKYGVEGAVASGMITKEGDEWTINENMARKSAIRGSFDDTAPSATKWRQGPINNDTPDHLKNMMMDENGNLVPKEQFKSRYQRVKENIADRVRSFRNRGNKEEDGTGKRRDKRNSGDKDRTPSKKPSVFSKARAMSRNGRENLRGRMSSLMEEYGAVGTSSSADDLQEQKLLTTSNVQGLSREEILSQKQLASKQSALQQGDDQESIMDKLMGLVLPITSTLSMVGTFGNMIINAASLGGKVFGWASKFIMGGAMKSLLAKVTKFIPTKYLSKIPLVGGLMSMATNAFSSAGVGGALGIGIDAATTAAAAKGKPAVADKGKPAVKAGSSLSRGAMNLVSRGTRALGGGGLRTAGMLGRAATTPTGMVAMAGAAGYGAGTLANKEVERRTGNTLSGHIAEGAYNYLHPETGTHQYSNNPTQGMVEEVIGSSRSNKAIPRVMSLQPSVLSNFYNMAVDYKEKTGKKLLVNDAARTPAQQDAVRGTSSEGDAGGTYTSMHVHGMAIDIDTYICNFLESSGLLRKWGFWRPLSWETWHIEPIGTASNITRAREDHAWANRMVLRGKGKGGGHPPWSKTNRYREHRDVVDDKGGEEFIGEGLPMDPLTGLPSLREVSHRPSPSSVSPVNIDLSRTEEFLSSIATTDKLILAKLNDIHQCLEKKNEVKEVPVRQPPTNPTFGGVPNDQYGVY